MVVFLNKLIDSFLVTVLGPLVLKLGSGWKTLSGLLLLALVWGFQMWASSQSLDAAQQANVQYWCTKAQEIAWALFGVGIIHKTLEADPNNVQVADPTDKK